MEELAQRYSISSAERSTSLVARRPALALIGSNGWIATLEVGAAQPRGRAQNGCAIPPCAPPQIGGPSPAAAKRHGLSGSHRSPHRVLLSNTLLLCYFSQRSEVKAASPNRTGLAVSIYYRLITIHFLLRSRAYSALACW